MPTPVYEYLAKQSDGFRHLYSSNPDIKSGWKKRGILFYVQDHWNEYGWCNANQHPIYWTQRLIQYHYDQSKTYGGWRFLYSFDENQGKDGWVMDKQAFHVYVYNPPSELYEKNQKWEWVNVTRYHKAQKDGWRFCFIVQGQKPEEEGWIKDNCGFMARRDDTCLK